MRFVRECNRHLRAIASIRARGVYHRRYGGRMSARFPLLWSMTVASVVSHQLIPTSLMSCSWACKPKPERQPASASWIPLFNCFLAFRLGNAQLIPGSSTFFLAAHRCWHLWHCLLYLCAISWGACFSDPIQRNLQRTQWRHVHCLHTWAGSRYRRRSAAVVVLVP